MTDVGGRSGLVNGLTRYERNEQSRSRIGGNDNGSPGEPDAATSPRTAQPAGWGPLRPRGRSRKRNVPPPAQSAWSRRPESARARRPRASPAPDVLIEASRSFTSFMSSTTSHNARDRDPKGQFVHVIHTAGGASHKRLKRSRPPSYRSVPKGVVRSRLRCRRRCGRLRVGSASCRSGAASDPGSEVSPGAVGAPRATGPGALIRDTAAETRGVAVQMRGRTNRPSA